jgi:hypothetical protein
MVVATSPLQCAGMNRHEAEDERALRVKTSDLLGPESCADTARDSVKRRQGLGGGGYPAPKRCNPDAAVFVMRGRQHEQER